MNLKLKPVVWVAEPDELAIKSKQLLELKFEVVYQKITASDLKQVFAQCDVLFFKLAFRIHESNLDPHQRCKIIATPVTGLDHIDLTACNRNNIRVISLKGATDFLKGIRATAEHTMALMLCLIRNIVPAANHVSSNQFNRNAFKGTELYQKTLGIIGYGRLGKIVAEYAIAFDMKICCFEINESKHIHHNKIQFCELDTLLAESDIISIHIDLNEGNEGFINKAFFSKIKKGAFLINTSRGNLVIEEDLVDALTSGHLAGAALDVVRNEPEIQFNDPLYHYQKQHDNLIITPHIGGLTVESSEKTEAYIIDQIIASF